MAVRPVASTVANPEIFKEVLSQSVLGRKLPVVSRGCTPVHVGFRRGGGEFPRSRNMLLNYCANFNVDGGSFVAEF